MKCYLAKGASIQMIRRLHRGLGIPLEVLIAEPKRAIEDHFDKNYELEDQIRGTGKEDLIQSTRDLIEACEFSYRREVEAA